MEWLLKIVEGPMKGAEIALVEGVVVSFGSGEDCDIIVQDATVPAKACEFEVDASGVRMAVGGGSSEPLPSFEVRSFGTTSFAVGPVDGEWQNLVKPVRPALERADSETADGRATAPSSPQSESGDKTVGETGAARPESAPSRRRPWILLVIIGVLLLLAAAVLAWRFWPQVKSWCDSHLGRQPAASATVAAPRVVLADLALTHGLVLTNYPLSSVDYPLLKGNLKRRTERLAIRALALAADSTVKFDLTDDETLFAAASELVFACSDGALKVEAASNRVVTLSGYSPSSAALTKAIRALTADVKGVERLETSRVTVGGPAPQTLAKTPFVREKPPGEHPVVVVPAHTPEDPSVAMRDVPIAGILTVPYPCVVMRNGLRLCEGASVGKATLVKIKADELTLRDGETTFTWRP